MSLEGSVQTQFFYRDVFSSSGNGGETRRISITIRQIKIY